LAVLAKLHALSLLLRLPRFRHLLEGTHPSGARAPLEASFTFSTRDGSVQLHARFEDGRMRVGRGPLQAPDVAIRFRRLEHMRAFFADGDPFNMLLRNQISFDGNLSSLARFGHLTTAIKQRGRQRSAAVWRRGPQRWQDLPAPPTGEPCLQRPAGEVRHLQDPYLAGTSLDDLPRIKRLLWAHRTVQPEICTERARLVTEAWLARPLGEEPPALRQGRVLEHLLREKRAIIHADDLLAGTTSSKRVGVILFPEFGGTAIWPELLTVSARQLNPYLISDQDVAILQDQVFPFWVDDNIREWARTQWDNPQSLRLDERFVLYFIWKNHAISHTIADMPGVLARGLDDIQREAVERELAAGRRAPFYQALQRVLAGVLAYAGNLAGRAERLAARSPDEPRRAELLELARICRKVPAQPAESLHEAIQAIWILFLCLHQENMNAGLSLGRLDLWLEPYLQRDLARIPDEAGREKALQHALELCCALMLKGTDHLPLVPDIGNRLFGGSSSDQALTLGGLRSDGSSAVCDATWLFLKATELLRLRDPNVNARYAPGVNSPAYLRRLCELNLLTRATPSIHNDDAMIPALLAQEFPLEPARDWGATGCVEPTLCGRHFGHTGGTMFNLVAPLEMALRDGLHPLVGERVGPRTGDPASFARYEQFQQAYETQLGWLLDQLVEVNDLLGQAHQALHPTPLLSALMQGPMEQGCDVVDGGATYNSSGSAMVGLTDVVDSLCAIRILLFERRRVAFPTLLRALDADFQGHELLLAEILEHVPRFGQDHPLPAEIAVDLQRFIFRHLQARRNYRGGRYLPGYWSMSNHVAFGILSGALPSGRRRGKAFTPGLTPAPSCGAPLTAQMRSVAALDSAKMPNNLAFNIKLVPGPDDSHSQILDRMAAYVAAYCDLGGMQLQFNVHSSETLRQAMEHPDQHRDLLVRISGYNAYFVDLNRDMQLELVERMEHSLRSA